MRTLRGVQDRVVVWWTLAALAVAGQVADIVSTLAVLGAGGSEHMRVGARLMALGDWPLIIAAKLLLALTVAVVLVAVARHPVARRSWAGAFMLAFAGLFAVGWWAIIGWNGAIWLVSAHALPWMAR
ncbi:MAG TPA: hypothetical protein VFN78_02550 [Ktedonobacterales bacterium]|nr:hypothetical protein [Ktedonobacterales bacterium]